jgi:DNA-binding CsgD family transcriptional regulator
MESQRIVRLTERQRLCLRLVHAHMSSKEIAARVGIEPGTVDQHIKTAMSILGVSDRRAAARILTEYEERERSPDQSPRITANPETTRFAPSTEDEWQPGRRLPSEAMKEEQAAFDTSPPAGRPALPLPIGGARPDHAGWRRRLLWIAVIAIGMALVIGVLVSALEALTRVVRN